MLSDNILPPTTAGINPEKFTDKFIFTQNRQTIILFLVFITIFGFFLRVNQLGAESFGEDEFNKLVTVNEYRNFGLSGQNGEHPFLMKGLQTISIILAEKWNSYFSDKFNFQISEETALRLPTVIIGSLTAIGLYFLFAELFGTSIGLICASIWSFDSAVIGFNRIAKEDSFFIFFFILANIFLIKSQTAAERGNRNYLQYFWISAIPFGGMLASKYYPHFFGVSVAYFNIFVGLSSTKWHILKVKWIYFFVLVGIAFVFFNPTIFLPSTWHEMLIFSSEKRIGHDAYEFLGKLFPNQLTAWLNGVPWNFYLIFILVKTPILTLIFFILGLPTYLFRKLYDGRYFVLFWFAIGVLTFSFLGGKFTRYFTLAEPLVVITAALGFYFTIQSAAKYLAFFFKKNWLIPILQTISFGLFLISLFWTSLNAAPHFRLSTNFFGGGEMKAGTYFPHDEFYDMSSREIAEKIAILSEPNSNIANETPQLLGYYLQKNGRNDLNLVSLSDKNKMGIVQAGDIIILAEGRRYFSNDRYWQFLTQFTPTFEIKVGNTTSARIYKLNDDLAKKICELAVP